MDGSRKKKYFLDVELLLNSFMHSLILGTKTLLHSCNFTFQSITIFNCPLTVTVHALVINANKVIYLGAGILPFFKESRVTVVKKIHILPEHLWILLFLALKRYLSPTIVTVLRNRVSLHMSGQCCPCKCTCCTRVTAALPGVDTVDRQ